MDTMKPLERELITIFEGIFERIEDLQSKDMSLACLAMDGLKIKIFKAIEASNANASNEYLKNLMAIYKLTGGRQH